MGVFALLVIGGCVSLVMYLNRSTEYCPIRHKINPDFYCRICDQRDGALLIEHFNLDTNELLLSVYKDSSHKWIEHPSVHAKYFSNAIDKNTIRFSATNSQEIIVNGEKLPMVTIQKQN